MNSRNPSLPLTMQAIEIIAPGGPEVLRLTQRQRPEPGPREVLIRHLAAGLNFPDVMQRKGLYAPPLARPTFRGSKWPARLLLWVPRSQTSN